MGETAPHGTASRYNNGACRCAPCKQAWADYIRDRARKHGRLSREALAAAKRMGLTRQRGESAIAFEKRMHETKAWLRNEPYYPDRETKAVTVHPTALGLQILCAVQARTGRDHDDILESLLRNYGQEIEFDENVTG